jgi:hypothetical protein
VDNVAVMMRLLVWGAVLTALVAGWAPAQTAAAVAVDGTVKDGAGLAVAGAIVTLETEAGAEQRTTTTNQAGVFHFGDVAAGSYKVTVASGGFALWTANVTAGVLNQALVAAVLQVAPMMSTIEVTPPPKELAAEQLKSEEKQRVLGVFPHFLVTYEPNAATLTAGQKFHLGFKTLLFRGRELLAPNSALQRVSPTDSGVGRPTIARGFPGCWSLSICDLLDVTRSGSSG